MTSKIPSFTMDLDADDGRVRKALAKWLGEDALMFTDAQGRELARVTSIELIHPSKFTDPVDIAERVSKPVITKVVATGRALRDGVQVTASALLLDNRLMSIGSPAAIVSEDTTEFNGQINAHWGEIWARSDVNLPNNWLTTIPRLYRDKPYGLVQYRNDRDFNDPWFRLRIMGEMYVTNLTGTRVAFPDGRSDDGYVMLSEAPDGYESPDIPYLTVTRDAADKDFDHLDNMLQRVPHLPFLNYDYHEVRSFFLQYDLPYYWTDEKGIIYGRDRDITSNTYGQVIGQDYNAWFNIAPNDPDYFDYFEQFTFIDMPPVNEEGEILWVEGATGKVPAINDEYRPRHPDEGVYAGYNFTIPWDTGTHSRGLLFAAPNMTMNGGGSPPDCNEILDPDGNPYVVDPDLDNPDRKEEFGVNHNGLIYSWGEINVGGTPTVYGSVYTVKGYGSGGTPEVYYNYRMKDGSWLKMNQSRVRRGNWAVVPGSEAPSSGKTATLVSDVTGVSEL